MRFACFNAVAPGATLAEQCEAIARAGCTGVETIIFPATPLETWQREMQAAMRDAGLAPAAVILGGLALYRGDSLSYVREAMHAASELGAVILLTPEYAPQDPLPLFPPHRAAPLQERARVDEAMRAIGAFAAELDAPVVIEPVTPFESRFCRSLADALALCDSAGTMHVRVAPDTHNMNITEAGIGESIRAAGGRIGHVHLADNNRLLPGRGHIDFGEVMTALRDVAYDGWLSFECAVLGDFEADVRRAIRRLTQS